MDILNLKLFINRKSNPRNDPAILKPKDDNIVILDHEVHLSQDFTLPNFKEEFSFVLASQEKSLSSNYVRKNVDFGNLSLSHWWHSNVGKMENVKNLPSQIVNKAKKTKEINKKESKFLHKLSINCEIIGLDLSQRLGLNGPTWCIQFDLQRPSKIPWILLHHPTFIER